MKATHKLGVVALVFVTAAVSRSHTSAGHGGLAEVLDSVTAVPSGSSYTPRSWAKAFLRADGMPVTACNLGFVTAWETAEGGNWHNTASYNPLNVTQPEPGARTVNSDHVKAYTSWHQGFAATVHVINNGRYPAVVAALRAGDSAQGAANAVAASPWGTSPFSAEC